MMGVRRLVGVAVIEEKVLLATVQLYYDMLHQARDSHMFEVLAALLGNQRLLLP
jgi:hypothetical protein